MAHTPHHPTSGSAAGSHGMSPLIRLFIYAVIVADLFALVYFGGTLLITGSLAAHAPENKVIVAGAEEAAAPATSTEAATPAFDLAAYVADPVKGAQVAAKCKACHNFDAGGPNRTGPNLFGIVGATVTHKPDFSYSTALVAKKAEWPTWTEAELHQFIENPKQTVPGTKMQFNGVRDPKDRADLIAWLKTLQ